MRATRAVAVMVLLAGLMVASVAVGVADPPDEPGVEQRLEFEGAGWWIVKGKTGQNYPEPGIEVGQGATVKMDGRVVPEHLRGRKCLIEVITSNNSSRHDTRLVIVSGEGRVWVEPEDEQDGETHERYELTLAEALEIFVELGEDEDTFSAELTVILSRCITPEPTPEPEPTPTPEPTGDSTPSPEPTPTPEPTQDEPTEPSIGPGSTVKPDEPDRQDQALANRTRRPHQSHEPKQESVDPTMTELPRTGLPAPALAGLAALLLGSGGALLRRS